MPPRPSRNSLPAVRERLVQHAARVLGRMPVEHQLRCVPIHRRSRAHDETELVEWRATFEADGRQWVATGADRDEALRRLETEVAGVPERAAVAKDDDAPAERKTKQANPRKGI